MRLVDLKTEHLVEPLGVWTTRPRFSWRVEDAPAASEVAAYEVELMDDRADEVIWRSTPDLGGGIPLVAYDGDALLSATAYRWRVRVRSTDAWSAWADTTFETSLIDRADWVAPFLEPAQDAITPDGPRRIDGDWAPPVHQGPLEERLHPVKYIRQSLFVRRRPVRARLYATAQGVYDAELNGTAVGDQLFAPGYESYDKYLSFQTYDVTESVLEGENIIGVRVADGWFGGRIDFTGSSAQYGDRLRLSWQLHLDHSDGTREILTSSDEAVSTDDGPIRYADIFIGERYDARLAIDGWSRPGFDDSSWQPVTLVDAPRALIPFKGEPVRCTQELCAARVLRTPSGANVVDFGQVIAGRVKMRVRGAAGTEVTLRHSETLDGAGEFVVNIAGFNKDQTDSYVVAGRSEGEAWEPAFTFHGFRYVEVTGYPGPLDAADFTAVVIGSDLTTTGGFSCSDPTLTRLHENAVWSQRANFLAIPTDCPQRERVGWTGDLQVFAPSATRNQDVRLFIERWLDNVRADQHPDGLVPVIVPAPPYMASLSDELADDPLLSIRAAAGWGDAIVLVPWVLYQRYGDAAVLAENYDAMRSWVDRQIRVAETALPKRLQGASLAPTQRDRQKLLWNSEPNFGDWNAPSIKVVDPSLEHMLAVAETTGEIIAAMFHFRVLEVLSDAATILNRHDDATRYRLRADAVRDAFAAEYLDGAGGLWSPTQGTYVLALAFGLVPAPQHGAAVERLVDLVHEANDHLDTGFLSVPYLLDVLWDNGHRALARTVLGQRSAPSWMYAVDKGATTIWEDWSAIGEDGAVAPSSLNHYAFGCVDDWIYRRIAGIEPAAPGYREVLIQPDLDSDLQWAHGWHDTPFGRIEVRWQRASQPANTVRISVQLPAGVTGRLVVSPDETRMLSSGVSVHFVDSVEASGE